MMRSARFALAAGALLTVFGCQSDTVTPSPIPLQASFSDGAHSGNPDFFFLPPIFKNPSADPNFEPAAFNPNVRPTVEICMLGLALPPSMIRACVAGDPVRRFSASDVQLSATDQMYHVNWDTKATNLNIASEYRIRVLLGTQELGYVDVDPVATGSALKNVETGQFIGLVDGRTLPIKFRIENAAACGGAHPCDSKTINLSQGGFVVLQSTGDRVDIPAQTSGQVVTVTVDLCGGIDVDLPVFGNCLRVRSSPPLAAQLSPPATVSMCSLRLVSIPLPHPQQDLLTLHRQDDAVINALPHSVDFCPPIIGRSNVSGGNLFAAAWNALRRAATSILPQPLHATTLVLDVGPAGDTGGFSDFQFALPAKMDFGSLIDQLANPLSAVGSVPSAVVTDANGNPVPGARVHFEITSEAGGTIAPTSGVVPSDRTTGRATLTEWRLGTPGRYSVRAFGRGIADPQNNGPAEGFDPFAPAVLYDRDRDRAQSPVSVGTGSLTFTATAGAPDLVISTGTPTVTPTVVAPGGTVTLSGWTNFNQGNANPTSGVENGFYLSTDAVITTSDVRLDGNGNTAGVLAAGHGFDWGGPTLTIPAATEPGNYYIGILVDESNAVVELNEANNFVSAPLTVAAVNVPSAPTNVSALRGDGQATVSWEPPGNSGGAPITGYTITASPGGVTASAFSASLVFPGLTNGTSYTFTVVATNSAGSGPASQSNAVTPAGPPGAVTGVAFSPGAAGGVLSWNSPSANGSAITRYVVDVRRDGVLVRSVAASDTRLSLANMPMCDYANVTASACVTQYTIRVSAINDVGNGALSAPFAATTKVSYVGDGLNALFQRQGCVACHNETGQPPLAGAVTAVYSTLVALDAALYEKPSGTSALPHAGGTLFSTSSFEYDVLSRWVRDGKFF